MKPYVPLRGSRAAVRLLICVLEGGYQFRSTAEAARTGEDRKELSRSAAAVMVVVVAVVVPARADICK